MEEEMDDINTDLSNEFWKELSDDVLESLYNQLEYVAGFSHCLNFYLKGLSFMFEAH